MEKTNKEIPATPDGFTKNNEAGFCCYRFFDVNHRCSNKAMKRFNVTLTEVSLCKACWQKQEVKIKAGKLKKESVK